MCVGGMGGEGSYSVYLIWNVKWITVNTKQHNLLPKCQNCCERNICPGS